MLPLLRTRTISPNFLANLAVSGPSAAARAKGLAKRQRQAGLLLSGGAAKRARLGQLSGRGLEQKDIEEHLAQVGKPGQEFVNRHKSSNVLSDKPLPNLPDSYTFESVHGETACKLCLSEYHTSMCDGSPNLNP
jgi:hypothetical protein